MPAATSVTYSDLIGIATAFIFQAFIASIVIVAFTALRSRLPTVYAPRQLFEEEEVKKPRGLSPGFSWSWLSVTKGMDDNALATKIGIDSLMFLMFLQFCRSLFMEWSAIGIPLFVIYYFIPAISQMDGVIKSGTPITISNSTTSAPVLSVLSISNINTESSWMWAPVVALIAFSVLAYVKLYKIWQTYVQLRATHVQSATYKASIEHRSLVLYQLPQSLIKSSPIYSEDQVETEVHDPAVEYISKCFGERPEEIVVGRELHQLPKHVDEHAKVTNQFEEFLQKDFSKTQASEDSTLTLFRSDEASKAIETENKGIWGSMMFVKVKAVPYYAQKLHNLEEKVYAERCEIDKPTSYAFMSFSTISKAYSINEGYKDKLKHADIREYPKEKLGLIKVEACPRADDIIWTNLELPFVARHARSLISIAIVLGITIGWTVIIAFIQTITNLDTISKYVPVLGDLLTSSPATIIFIQSIVAPLLLVIMNSVVLPLLLRTLSHFQGLITQNAVEQSTLTKFFWFQVYQLLFTIAFGSCISSLLALFSGSLDTNASGYINVILGLVVRGFINSSTYYIAFIAVGLSVFAMELLQIAPLVFHFIRLRFADPTPRQNMNLSTPPVYQSTIVYGSLLLNMMLAFTYSVLSPIILPFAAIQFYVAEVVMKYQFLYVYESAESDGTWWPKVFNFIMFSIGFAQVMTLYAIAVLSSTASNQGNLIGQIVVLVLLVICSVGYWIWIRLTKHYQAKDITFLMAHPSFISASDDAAGMETDTESDKTVGEHCSPAYFGVKGIERFAKGDVNGDLLGHHVHPRALIQPLPKIWVKPEYSSHLAMLYAPEYKDELDYLMKHGQVVDKEAMHRMQVKILPRAAQTIMRRLTSHRRGRRIDGEALSASGAEETTEDVPPEWKDFQVTSAGIADGHSMDSVVIVSVQNESPSASSTESASLPSSLQAILVKLDDSIQGLKRDD